LHGVLVAVLIMYPRLIFYADTLVNPEQSFESRWFSNDLCSQQTLLNLQVNHTISRQWKK
jgi:hypothetical protein